MKYTLILFSAIILFSCGGTDLSTFKDETNGFQIDYPTTWDTTNLDYRMAFMAREDFVDSTDIFSEGFSISVFDNEGKGLEEIVDENIKMAEMYYGESNIEKENITNDNGVDGIRLTLDYEAGDLKLTNLATFFNSEKNLYTITQSAEESSLPEYRELFEEIINSFALIE